ncbi:unnamed protein product [Amoebophrya sp. A120]|nr:unnamed protein product [Amoebophrya sp. A120]|eukprot:GSA120T00019418001.1
MTMAAEQTPGVDANADDEDGSYLIKEIDIDDDICCTTEREGSCGATSKRTIKIHQVFSNSRTNAVVWDAGLVLAHFLMRSRSLVEGKNVLELGAGTGIVGLVAGFVGARKVCLTDLPDAIALLRRNVERNHLHHSGRSSFSVPSSSYSCADGLGSGGASDEKEKGSGALAAASSVGVEGNTKDKNAASVQDPGSSSCSKSYHVAPLVWGKEHLAGHSRHFSGIVDFFCNDEYETSVGRISTEKVEAMDIEQKTTPQPQPSLSVDVVLLGDCLFEPEGVEALIETLVELRARAQHSPKPLEILCAYEVRTEGQNRGLERGFLEAMAKDGLFVAERIELAKLHPDYCCEDIPVWRLVSRSKDVVNENERKEI